MILTTPEIKYIQKIISLANLLGIENLIIEPNKIRAMNTEQTIVLFQDKNVPEMQFGSLGLNRLKDFTSRLDIVLAQDNFTIDATTAGVDNTIGFDIYEPGSKVPAPMWIRSMLMAAKNTKINFRSASPQTIKAPKVRATGAAFGVDLTPDVVSMITKGKGAMKTDEVGFVGNKDGVWLELIDINGDVLEYQFADSSHINIIGKEPEFEYKYPIDSLLRIFKPNPTGTFHITERGQLSYTVDDIDVYIMARL
jgi:hypothetical protein